MRNSQYFLLITFYLSYHVQDQLYVYLLQNQEYRKPEDLLRLLLQHLLLDRTPGTQKLWEQGHWDELTLGQALPLPEVIAQPPALVPFVLPR